MSDRWCDDCAWPEECAAEVCCRRREAGEIRSAAPSETAAKIERDMGQVELIQLPYVETIDQVWRRAMARHGLYPEAVDAITAGMTRSGQ